MRKVRTTTQQEENLMSKHKVEQQKRQTRQRARAERRRKRQVKQSIGELRRNQVGIAKKLLAGEVPLVCATAWGFVEGLLGFMER